ncbi:DUF2484 family protein [Paracoccus saliphilus]|uniref:DUF2484 family protein n=1 Tax=Paracoccus saliphilus TaxID=405559 RepID=A0AA46A4Q3_9RHOB|nr:DUF2484 family protein [Paracoccus saliphilus]WCR02004.1 DUF2484 family protein [Paracoccus saliphilus]SIS66365.1 Protein of unknown function [Paracoccus saliphilus]
MNEPHVISGVMALSWMVLAALLPRVAWRYRAPAFWGMIVMGVPVLGWLTLHWGPGIGVAAFAIGLCVLLFQPLRPRDGKAGRTLHDTAPPGPGTT